MMNQFDKKIRIPCKPGYRAICVLMWIVACVSFAEFMLNGWMFLRSCHTHCNMNLLINSIFWLIFAIGFARCWYALLMAFVWVYMGYWPRHIYFLLRSKDLLQPQCISVFLILVLTILSIIALWLFVVKIQQINTERLKLRFNEPDISKIHKKYKWTNFMLLMFGLLAFITFEMDVFSSLYNTMLYMKNGIISIFFNIWLIKLLFMFTWIAIIIAAIKKYRLIFPLFLPLSILSISAEAIYLNRYYWHKSWFFFMPTKLLALSLIALVIINILGCTVFLLEAKKLKTLRIKRK